LEGRVSLRFKDGAGGEIDSDENPDESDNYDFSNEYGNSEGFE
jgi:hypothetical protein